MDCDIFIFDTIPTIYALLCLLQHYFLYSKYKGVGFIADTLILCQQFGSCAAVLNLDFNKIKIQIGGHKNE